MKNNIWNSNFTYGVGLLATDGCLSNDGRHIEFNSKDLELVKNFKKAFCLNNKIGKKQRGGSKRKSYHRVQFGNVGLYKFLVSIGLSPRKSHTIGRLKIPKSFFPDFLRGVIDGGGCIGYFNHPETSKKQFRIRVTSASIKFLKWLNSEINSFLGTDGTVLKAAKAYELCYYKKASHRLVYFIYHKGDIIFLQRKMKKARLIMGEGGGIGIRASLRS